jgi:hypothetical protein
MKKYDQIVWLIFIAGVIFLLSLFFIPKASKGNQAIILKADFPIEKDVDLNQLKAETEIYFSNANSPSKIEEVKELGDGKVEYTLRDTGELTGTKLIFAGQHISLNQRVKVHGLVEAEGTVVSFQAEK